MRRKVTAFIVLSLLLFVVYSFAYWEKKPVLRWSQFYRYDNRRDNSQLYINRLSASFNYNGKNNKSLFKITPFFEIRRNIDRDLWEREELGMEIGKDVFSWLYLGESIQRVWLREDYRRVDQGYTWREKRESTEAETRLLVTHNLFSNKRIELKGFILDEYTYDFRIGAGTRNEVAIGVILPVNKNIETGINCRHIDRIHDFDSDTIEASLTLVF